MSKCHQTLWKEALMVVTKGRMSKKNMGGLRNKLFVYIYRIKIPTFIRKVNRIKGTGNILMMEVEALFLKLLATDTLAYQNQIRHFTQ